MKMVAICPACGARLSTTRPNSEQVFSTTGKCSKCGIRSELTFQVESESSEVSASPTDTIGNQDGHPEEWWKSEVIDPVTPAPVTGGRTRTSTSKFPLHYLAIQKELKPLRKRIEALDVKIASRAEKVSAREEKLLNQMPASTSGDTSMAGDFFGGCLGHVMGAAIAANPLLALGLCGCMLCGAASSNDYSDSEPNISAEMRAEMDGLSIKQEKIERMRVKLRNMKLRERQLSRVLRNDEWLAQLLYVWGLSLMTCISIPIVLLVSLLFCLWSPIAGICMLAGSVLSILIFAMIYIDPALRIFREYPFDPEPEPMFSWEWNIAYCAIALLIAIVIGYVIFDLIADGAQPIQKVAPDRVRASAPVLSEQTWETFRDAGARFEVEIPTGMAAEQKETDPRSKVVFSWNGASVSVIVRPKTRESFDESVLSELESDLKAAFPSLNVSRSELLEDPPTKAEIQAILTGGGESYHVEMQRFLKGEDDHTITIVIPQQRQNEHLRWKQRFLTSYRPISPGLSDSATNSSQSDEPQPEETDD